MTGKRSVKTNLKINFEITDNVNSSTVNADKYNKKFDNFATTVEGPTKEELTEVKKIVDQNDDKVFVFPTNMSEFFKTLGILKKRPCN